MSLKDFALDQEFATMAAYFDTPRVYCFELNSNRYEVYLANSANEIFRILVDRKRTEETHIHKVYGLDGVKQILKVENELAMIVEK